MILQIQNLDIDTLHIHCYTLFACAICPAIFPTFTGGLWCLFLTSCCILPSNLLLLRGWCWRPCTHISGVVDDLPHDILALTGDLGTLQSQFRLFMSIQTTKFPWKFNTVYAWIPLAFAHDLELTELTSPINRENESCWLGT